MSQNHPSPHHHHNLSYVLTSPSSDPEVELRTMAAPKQRGLTGKSHFLDMAHRPLYLDLHHHFLDP